MQDTLKKRHIKLAKTVEKLSPVGQGIMFMLALGLKESHDLYEKKFGNASRDPTRDKSA